MEAFRKNRKRAGILFVVCMFLGAVETLFFHKISGEPMWVVTGSSSLNFSNLVVMLLVILLGGLFIPMYVVAKKYE